MRATRDDALLRKRPALPIPSTRRYAARLSRRVVNEIRLAGDMTPGLSFA